MKYLPIILIPLMACCAWLAARSAPFDESSKQQTLSFIRKSGDPEIPSRPDIRRHSESFRRPREAASSDKGTSPASATTIHGGGLTDVTEEVNETFPSSRQRSHRLGKASSSDDFDQAPPTSPFPAVWVELPGLTPLDAEMRSELQKDAEELLEQLDLAQHSEFPARTKAELINASDAEFRRKYGVRAWLAHHVQSRNLFGK